MKSRVCACGFASNIHVTLMIFTLHPLNTEVRSEICLTWSACTVAPLQKSPMCFRLLEYDFIRTVQSRVWVGNCSARRCFISLRHGITQVAYKRAAQPVCGLCAALPSCAPYKCLTYPHVVSLHLRTYDSLQYLPRRACNRLSFLR